MDIPLTFLGCNFKLAGDVIIRTADDAPLAAYYCNFFSCGNMWKGIEAKGNRLVSFWWCEFEDAKLTLQVDDIVPEVMLFANRFNRNHVNIANGSSHAGGDGTLNFPFFAANIFTCYSNTNQNNQQGVPWVQYHVHLDHCATSLSAGHFLENYFQDAPTQIYLEDADLVIRHAEFSKFN